MGYKLLMGRFGFLLCVLGTSALTKSKGTSGKEFVFAPMPNLHYDDETVGVVIQVGNEQSKVRISVPGREEMDHHVTLTPDAGPYNYPISASLIHQNTSGLVKESTVVITSDKDVSVLVYNMAPFTSDIFTALPKKYLGHEYFVALIARETGTYPLFSGVISISSHNQISSIEMHLRSTVEFEDRIFYSGDIFRYILLPYESIQLLPRYTNITGTHMVSNATIAVSAGSKCANVPWTFTACDHLAEQLAPFKAWGKQFVVSPFAGRSSGYVLQIVAGRDNTSVVRSNLEILKLDMGEYHTIDVPSQEMIFLFANKPIFVLQYAKGAGTDHKDDPSMIRVDPNEQFASEATFSVYNFPDNLTTINVMYLGITADCTYLNSVIASKDNVYFSPNWTEEYSIETHTDTQMCTRWAEVVTGSYSLRSREVVLPDGQTGFPRFCAVIYGSGYDSESYVYRAAFNDRTLTCTCAFGSNGTIQEFDCPEYCSPSQIGNMTFPQGQEGASVDSYEICPPLTPLGGQPRGRAVCVNNALLGTSWNITRQTECGPARSSKQVLDDILKNEITNDTVEKVIEETAAVSDSPEELTQTDVINIALILKNITDLEIDDPKITTLMTDIVSNTAEVDEEDLYEIETNMGAITEILEAFEDQLKYVAVPNNGTFTTSSANVAVQVTDVAPGDYATGLNISIQHINFTDAPTSNISYHPAEDPSSDSRLPLEIVIPSSVLDGDKVRVALAVFRTSALFGSRSLREVNEMESGFNRSANSLVVGLTVGGEEMTELEENIVFVFTPIKNGYQNPTCAFWDTSIPDWSTIGCQQITSQNKNNEQTYNTTQAMLCSCDHLTNFAVLMDIHASTNSVPVLRILSFIGCSISIVSLLITLVTYLSNKNLHAHQSQKIFLCLCGTLLCLYITFIIMSALDIYPGMPDNPEVEAGPCGFLAALVHFFTISSLAWMGVEGFNTYLVIVRVFNSYIPRFMIKAGLVAWGIPGVIVALTGAVARRKYASPDYCFLQFWPLIDGLLIPIALILFFNIVVFVLVIRELSRSADVTIKTHESTLRRKDTIKRVKNAVGILILLGLTWITGYFTLIETGSIIAQAVFIILNSIQGLAILVFYCLRNPVVRSYWRKMMPLACRRESKEDHTASSHMGMSQNTHSASGRTLSSSSSHSEQQ